MQALKGNAKIAHYPSPGEDLFLFRPALGLDVRSRKQLLEKLMEYERKGLGGVLMSEVKEALHNPEKAVKVSRLVSSVQTALLCNRPFTIMMYWGGGVKVGTKWKIYMETCMFLCFLV